MKNLRNTFLYKALDGKGYFQYSPIPEDEDVLSEATEFTSTCLDRIKTKYVLPVMEKKGFYDFVPFDPIIGAVSEKAVNSLQRLIDDKCIEIKSLGSYGSCEFFLFNVLRTFDAIDWDNSQVIKDQDTGSVLSIQKRVLKKVPDDLMCFRATNDPWGPVFLTIDFLHLIADRGLAGCGIGIPERPFFDLKVKPWDGSSGDLKRFENY